MLILVTGLVLTGQYALELRMRRRRAEEFRLRDQAMSELYQHGFFETIIDRQRRLTAPSDRDKYWLIRAYLATGRNEAAHRQLPIASPEGIDLYFELVEAYVESGYPGKAFRLAAEKRGALRSADKLRYERLIEKSFTAVSRTALSGDFVSGWHGDWAIMRDEQGSFFIDRRGRPGNGMRYESVRASEAGFEVIHQGKPFILDDQLNVLSGDARKVRRKVRRSDGEAAEPHLRAEQVEGGVQLFCDAVAVSPVYEAAGSPDPQTGHIIVKQDGKWMLLHLICLEMGYN